MLARRESAFADLVAVADAGILALSLLAACALYGATAQTTESFAKLVTGHLTVLWVALALWTFLARRSGLAVSSTYHSRLYLLGRVLRVQVLGGLGLTSAEYLARPGASRLLTAHFLAISFIALIAEKLCVRSMLLHRAERKRAQGRPRALVVGVEGPAGTYFDLLREQRFWALTVADFIPWDEPSTHANGNGRAAKDGAEASIGGAIASNGVHFNGGLAAAKDEAEAKPAGRTVEQWDRLIAEYVVDEVVAAMPWNRAVDTDALAAACARRGVTFRELIEMPEAPVGKYSVEDLGAGRYLLSLETVPDAALALLVKRAIDIVGALVGLVLCGIAYLWYAPRLRRESPGPILFRQPRVGENGRVFNVCKFRTMWPDAELRLSELMKYNEMRGLLFKMRDDPRVTPTGRFIRQRHIDEMPQFWNVLKGEMSLVGTRPPTVNEVAHYEPHHYRRLSMKPGITGLWQLNGSGEVREFEDVVKLDCQYIDNWSLAEDFKILAKTAIKVLRATAW